MLGTIRNWGRWSEIYVVGLLDIELGVWIFEKILSIRVLEQVLILVGWNICRRNKCEENESRNSFVGACLSYSAQKMKFSMKDFSSKCDQVRRKLGIWSHLLKKSLMENFIFCAVIFQKVTIKVTKKDLFPEKVYQGKYLSNCHWIHLNPYLDVYE